jgi:polyhydroxybutyrate depolymerase
LIACRLADKVAAVATVAGVMFPADCAPSRPIPILAIHGTADRFVTFDGTANTGLETLTWNSDSREAFAGLPFAPAAETMAKWATANGCAPKPTETPMTPAVRIISYDGCCDGAAVRLYVVEGGGHTWPGSQFSKASETILGPTTFDFDADDVIWSFFREHHL